MEDFAIKQKNKYNDINLSEEETKELIDNLEKDFGIKNNIINCDGCVICTNCYRKEIN